MAARSSRLPFRWPGIEGLAINPEPAETVYVVDDDPSLRKALARMFRTVGVAVETFESAEAFLAHPRPALPACLVLDVWMPDVDGLALQTRLKAAGTDIPVVFITGRGDVLSSVRAMKDGAVDFIEKPFSDDDLLSAVRDALARSRAQLLADGERHVLEMRASALTGREREVMVLVTQGLANKVIAARLRISEKTVKVHRGRVMDKMQARSLADLIGIAQRVRLARSS
jgi:FixJ family two-component response regulator